ncbi:MAG: hypothetical protein OER21_08890 [Gemmatimonadota bacterium]|nr:hypothetical protein [Gemmatimonadota bacterium]
MSLTPARAAAQARERPLLEAAARVRLIAMTAAGPRAFAGRLLLLDPHGVTIRERDAASPLSFRVAELRRFQVNRGKPRALIHGAPLVGAALGAWFGATALAPDAACDVPGNPDPACRWEVSPTLVGAGGGAILFAVAVGLLVPDVWEDIPLEAFAGGVHWVGGRSVRIALRVRLLPPGER